MKNKKGFTLIELLAVIVILGLLMAIAIPSVTKYIQQSRVKTLIDTVNSYSEAAVTGVNDLEYGSMSDSNNLYYIPIECLSIEKGGTNPFGDWEEAYVVVHYNAEEYSYDYYFTYYDSAGYGMKLTPINELKYTSIENPTEMNKDTITKQTLNDENIYITSTDRCSFNGENVAGQYTLSFDYDDLSSRLSDIKKIYYTYSSSSWENVGSYKASIFNVGYNYAGYYSYVNKDGYRKGFSFGKVTLSKNGKDYSSKIVSWKMDIEDKTISYGTDVSLGKFTCSGKGNNFYSECNPAYDKLSLAVKKDTSKKSSHNTKLSIKIYLNDGNYIEYSGENQANYKELGINSDGAKVNFVHWQTVLRLSNYYSTPEHYVLLLDKN